MSILVFQHEPHETPAMLGKALVGHGHRLRIIKLYEGQTVPVDLDDVDGVIALGGMANVDETDRYNWLIPEMAYLKNAHDAGLPVVGICLGAQLIAAALGGKVAAMPAPEVGWKTIRMAFPGQTDVIHQGIAHETVQFHLHGQEVTTLPPDSAQMSSSQQCKNQAFRVGLKTYAFQYHFEWDAADLAIISKDPSIAQAGQSILQLSQHQQQHYPTYRRIGDRLCSNLAILLFNAGRKK